MSAAQLLAVPAPTAPAYDDREEHAYRVVVRALEEATALIRDGKPGMAQFRMARAEMSARRILGQAVPS